LSRVTKLVTAAPAGLICCRLQFVWFLWAVTAAALVVVLDA